MKHFLLTFFIFLVFHSIGQDLVLSPNVVRIGVDPAEFETVAHAWLINTSSEEKEYRWIRITNDLSDNWKSAICDNQACYSTTVDTAIFMLAAGDSSNLDVHIRPNGVDGTAKVVLQVQELNNPEVFVEGQYIFNETVSSYSYTEPSITIYPNPATDYFRLSDDFDVSKVIVYNVVGRRMKEFGVYPNKKYDIADLNRGMYLVRLLDGKKEIIKTLRLNKR